MTDRPQPLIAGTLAFTFLRKLCEHLERENKLAPGEAARIWAGIAIELEPKRGQDFERACIDTISALGLAKP